MAKRDIVVVGASAGGVEALKQLVSGLPKDFPAAMLVVLHVSAHGVSYLPQILSRAGALPAVHAQDHQAIQQGHIYIAPPDRHLVVQRGYLALTRGPQENDHRPAVDPLFRTAARVYDSRVIGIVLSGVLDDGTAGMVAVKARGGLAICQHPNDAMYPQMPLSVAENVEVDHIVSVGEMPELLGRLVREEVRENPLTSVSPLMVLETDAAEGDVDYDTNVLGEPSEYVCPACGGTLWEIHDHELVRFRCRVGHAYSAQTLIAQQDEALDEALWTALRALEENAALNRKMAERAGNNDRGIMAKRYREKAENLDMRADIIRQVLFQSNPPSTEQDTFEASNRVDPNSRKSG